MKYDFDSVIDRRNSGSLKWDIKENELPMWVADMDFKAAPEIVQALQKRLEHGVFGYTVITDEWYSAYIDWWKRRHNFVMEKERISFCTGVVPAISSMVRSLTKPKDKVVVQTPVYNIFFNSIRNSGRIPAENPLIYKDGEYSVDFEGLEKLVTQPDVTMLLLCNPQNPAGKIWDRGTLDKIGRICADNNTVVVSDEIHCDITDPDKDYIPFASVSEICKNNSVCCFSPSKAFNIAGLQSAAVYAYNKELFEKAVKGLNADEVAEPNAFALTAAIAAFNNGEEWLLQLREYLYKNKTYAFSYIRENIPDIMPVHSEATYLLWLDCSRITDNSAELSKSIRNKTGLFLSAGVPYGGNGKNFLRLNAACPLSVLKDGLERLKNALN